MRILLGEISSYKAIVIASFLKKEHKNLYIISYDYNRITKNVHTRYSNEHLVLANLDKDTYIDTLADYCASKKIDIFIPVHSDYMGTIIKKKKAFGKSLNYIGNYNNYLQLHEKDILLSMVKDLDIDTPITYDSFNSAQVPFVAKPKNKSSSKGVVYIFSESDRKKFKKIITAEYIFQEYISGFGCGYSVYVDKGRIIKSYGHKRLAEYPISGGSSIYRKSFFDDRMFEVATMVFNQIPWTGFAMIEFKYTLDNRLILIEINPRIWGSINQGLQNGVDFFEPIIGKSNLSKTGDINTFLSPQLYLNFLIYIFKFNFNPILYFLKNLTKNKSDVSFINDPLGYVSIIFRKLL